MDKPLVHAIGGALGLIGGLLQKSGVAAQDEFANLMALYATITAETDPEQGQILDVWALMLRDIADGDGGGDATN